MLSRDSYASVALLASKYIERGIIRFEIKGVAKSKING